MAQTLISSPRRVISSGESFLVAGLKRKTYCCMAAPWASPVLVVDGCGVALVWARRLAAGRTSSAAHAPILNRQVDTNRGADVSLRRLIVDTNLPGSLVTIRRLVGMIENRFQDGVNIGVPKSCHSGRSEESAVLQKQILRRHAPQNDNSCVGTAIVDSP